MFNRATDELVESGELSVESRKAMRRSALNSLRTPHSAFRTRLGFTLIEMMVVVGVIALLAGMMIGAMPALTEKKIRSRVQSELAALETAINSYHANKGFYPPDNTNNAAQPPLFYELTGTVIRNPSATPLSYESIFDQKSLTSTEINNAFRIEGFLNSGTDKSQVKNFYPTLKASAFGTNGAVKVLVVPYSGPQGSFNPWRYVSSTPTNNVNGYDLWAEVVIRGKPQIISNWKQ